MPKTVVDDVWLDPITAEAKAKTLGHDLWRSQLVLTFGKYAGQTFKWLLENDVGWVVWLLAELLRSGEKNEYLRWVKEQLQEFVKEFSVVQVHVDKKRLKVRFYKYTKNNAHFDGSKICKAFSVIYL